MCIGTCSTPPTDKDSFFLMHSSLSHESLRFIDAGCETSFSFAPLVCVASLQWDRCLIWNEWTYKHTWNLISSSWREADKLWLLTVEATIPEASAVVTQAGFFPLHFMWVCVWLFISQRQAWKAAFWKTDSRLLPSRNHESLWRTVSAQSP